MSGLAPDDLAVVSNLLGAGVAHGDGPAIAASIADLRASLPEFRRAAYELLQDEEAQGD
jgi:hypothetical protein